MKQSMVLHRLQCVMPVKLDCLVRRWEALNVATVHEGNEQQKKECLYVDHVLKELHLGMKIREPVKSVRLVFMQKT